MLNLAGQRIAEGSHRLSTAEEVRVYLAHHKQQAELIRKLEIARKNTLVMAPEVKVHG